MRIRNLGLIVYIVSVVFFAAFIPFFWEEGTGVDGTLFCRVYADGFESVE